jgi:hypothetical protein
MRRATTGAVIVALLGSITWFAAATAATTTPAYPAWTTPLPLAGGGAEPSIRNASDGRRAAYISAPTGLGSNFWYVDEVHNPDGTVTFKPSPPRQPDLGTGGGDSEISISDRPDPRTGCDVIAYSGLHNIDTFDNFTTATSHDCGAGFSAPNLFATQNTLTDRQWQTFDGARTNFLIFHKVDLSQIVVTRSYDAGTTYSSDSPEGARGIIDDKTLPSVINTNEVGNIVTDHSQPIAGRKYPNGDQVHALYAIFEGPRDPADNAQAQIDAQVPGRNFDHDDTVYVARSVDGGTTWTDTKVYSTNPRTEPKRELNLLFPVVAVDRAGTLYAVWADGFKVQYAFSTNHGATWSKAYQVNPGNGANIFPWVAAGGNGRIDLVWYHAEGCKKPGCATTYRNPGDEGTVWTVAFAQLFDANRLGAGGVPAPTVTKLDQKITPPIHRGSVCNNGTFCLTPVASGNRTLLDFFQVSIDNAGRANIAYAADYATPGSATITYTRQNAGLSAIDGSTVANLHYVSPNFNLGNSCPGPQVLDPVNDAPGSVLVDPGAKNVDTLDLRSVQFSAPDPSHLEVVLTVKNLSASPPPPDVSSLWAVLWQYGGKTYYVDATTNGPALQSYDDGTYNGDFNPVGTPAGTFRAGANGTITWVVDRRDVGSPANGATLASPYAEDHGAFTVLGNGVQLVADTDRAPDAGPGSSYVVGASCPAPAPAQNVARAVAGSELPATGSSGAPALIGAALILLGMCVRRLRTQ